MDVPGICLLNNVDPDAELLKAVTGHGTTLLVSPYNMDETCDRLRRVLLDYEPPRHE
jgi:serine kinase of HPr protein (carbohydrate metabolism regulator)